MSGTQEILASDQRSAQAVTISCGKKKGKLTQERLKEVLDYNPETGVFIWKCRMASYISVGSVAGSIAPGYVKIQINRSLYPAHRLAWLYMYGHFPEFYIDHINEIKNDNRIVNLREVKGSCNVKNTSVARRDNTSGIKGVHLLHGKWVARACEESGKRIYLGFFTSKLEAAKARYAAEVKFNYSNCAANSTAKKFIDLHKEEE